MKEEILKNVLAAMQDAEEMGGPQGQEYLALMAEIAREAIMRINNFNSWHNAVWTDKDAM